MSENDGMIVLSFSKSDISYVEMVNTLAYLESKEDCKNILFMEASIGRPKWRVYETSDHVVVKIHDRDVKVIQ